MARPRGQGEFFPEPKVRLTVDDEGRVVDRATGQVLDLQEAIDATRWVTATMYPPPHQYVIFGRTPALAFDVLATAILERTDSYLAFFRGYKTPNRYLDLPDHRYWRSSSGGSGRGVTHMLNRCTYDSVEPPSRVDQGAKPEPWGDGPPWLPKGSQWPEWFSPDENGVMRDRSQYGDRTRAFPPRVR